MEYLIENFSVNTVHPGESNQQRMEVVTERITLNLMLRMANRINACIKTEIDFAIY